MTVKEQLEKIKSNRNRLRLLQSRKNTLKASADLHSIDYASDKVQTSGNGSSVENAVFKVLEREKQLDREITAVILENDDLLSKIQSVDNGGIYSQVLYMKYAEDKELKEIACELDYDYKYLCTMHNKALKLFGELYPMES